MENNIGRVTEKTDIVFLDQVDLLTPAITIEVLAEDLAIKQSVLNDLPFKFKTFRLLDF